MSEERSGVFSAPRASSDDRPRDAATVVLLREGLSGVEVFLLQRHGKSAFMGGAYVFPGGKVDVEDQAAAMLERLGPGDVAWCRARLEETPNVALSPEDAAGIHVAACRELFEEAGVLLARGRDGRRVAPEVLPGLRAELAAGASFAALLSREGLQLALRELTYFAHWITPAAERRRFDTRFFLAVLPAGQSALLDQTETVAEAWMGLTDALEAHREGRVFLPPPTQRTLEELLACGSLSAMRARAEVEPVQAVLPKLTVVEDVITIVLPWDPLYAELEGEGLPAPPRFGELPGRIEVRPPQG